MAAPKEPSDLQGQVYLRFVNPDDDDDVIQMELIDTGKTAPDGKKIYALATAPSSGAPAHSKTAAIMFTGSIAAGVTSLGTVIDCSGFDKASITIEAVHNALAAVGITVDLISSSDNTKWDDVATDPFVQDLEPSFGAGATRQVSWNLDLLPKYLDVSITNLDVGQAVDVTVTIVPLL